MKNKIHLFLIPILLTITLSIPQVYHSLNLPPQNRMHPTLNSLPTGLQTLKLPFNRYVEELDIKFGDEVEAIIKATEVMIAK